MANELYKLEWTTHVANFLQSFVEHQSNGTLVDITLSCEGQFIKAHKLILSACSDYFQGLLQIHETVQHPIIILNGTKVSTLSHILHFMYNGQVKVSEADLADVLALGESLQIKGLSSVKLKTEPVNDNNVATSNNKSTKLQKEDVIKQYANIENKVQPRIPINGNKPAVPIILRNQNNKKPLMAKPTGNNLLTFKTSQLRTSSEPLLSVSLNNASERLTTVSSNNNNPQCPNNLTNTANSESITTSPKPQPAFMIFANQWRKKLSIEYPDEGNKEISVRLRTMWKNLLPEAKNPFYNQAQKAEEEYRRTHPDEYKNSVKRKAEHLNESTNEEQVFATFNGSKRWNIEEIEIRDSD